MSDKTIIGAENRYAAYLNALKTDFTKVTRLEFLTPSGSVGYALDNDYKNRRSGAFLQQGAISCNLQNGARRQADITLSNLDEEYNYAVGQIWFGQQIRILEGLLLPIFSPRRPAPAITAPAPAAWCSTALMSTR